MGLRLRYLTSSRRKTHIAERQRSVPAAGRIPFVWYQRPLTTQEHMPSHNTRTHALSQHKNTCPLTTQEHMTRTSPNTRTPAAPFAPPRLVSLLGPPACTEPETRLSPTPCLMLAAGCWETCPPRRNSCSECRLRA